MYYFLKDNMVNIVTIILGILVGVYIYASARKFKSYRKALYKEPVMQRFKEPLVYRISALGVLFIIEVILVASCCMLTDSGLYLMTCEIPDIFTHVEFVIKILIGFIGATFIGISAIFIWLAIVCFFYGIHSFIVAPELEFIEPDAQKRIEQYAEYKEQQRKDKEEEWREI